MKGSKSSRDRHNADITVPDDIAPSDADAASDEDEYSVADLDVGSSDEAGSPEVALLDLEAEEDNDGKQTDNEDLADMDVGEDLDTYKASFIDDSDLHEREDDDDEEIAVVGVSNIADEVMSTDDSKSVDMDDEDDVPL